MGPGVEACYTTVHLLRAACPPLLLGGGALVILDFPRPKRVRADSSADNHSGMRHIEESGFAALARFPYVTPPPRESVAKII